MTSIADLRTQLCAAHRWAAEYGLNEGIDNHLSVRVDDTTMLVTPFGIHWQIMEPQDILRSDFEGQVIDGTGTVERTAACIHGAVYRRQKQVNAILHTHMSYATAIACSPQGKLEMIHQNAGRFLHRIFYEREFSGVAFDDDEGERIAKAAGRAPVVFLQNHGVVVTGPNIALAFDDLYYLERLAKLQVLTAALGNGLQIIDEATIEHAAGQIMTVLDHNATVHFRALLAILARRDNAAHKWLME